MAGWLRWKNWKRRWGVWWSFIQNQGGCRVPLSTREASDGY